jgi:hypothetical protein
MNVDRQVKLCDWSAQYLSRTKIINAKPRKRTSVVGSTKKNKTMRRMFHRKLSLIVQTGRKRTKNKTRRNELSR